MKKGIVGSQGPTVEGERLRYGARARKNSEAEM